MTVFLNILFLGHSGCAMQPISWLLSFTGFHRQDAWHERPVPGSPGIRRSVENGRGNSCTHTYIYIYTHVYTVYIYIMRIRTLSLGLSHEGLAEHGGWSFQCEGRQNFCIMRNRETILALVTVSNFCACENGGAGL